jgi:hypothetical protein
MGQDRRDTAINGNRFNGKRSSGLSASIPDQREFSIGGNLPHAQAV